jgi:hypothetical protein
MTMIYIQMDNITEIKIKVSCMYWWRDDQMLPTKKINKRNEIGVAGIVLL